MDERLRLHMIEAPSGCWIWIGARNAFGHGRIQVEGRTAYAHRAGYETWVGPIPDGMQLDHLCRRPACINPRHLQPVTAQTNVLRGTSPGARARRRDACRNGHPYAEFGKMQAGRRICRQCRDGHLARYRSKPRGSAGSELRALRQVCGLTQGAVAGRAGMYGSRLSAIEQGKADLDAELATAIRTVIAQLYVESVAATSSERVA